MAQVTLHDVSLEIPLLSRSSYSLKQTLARKGGFGRIRADGGHAVVSALKNISLAVGPGERVGLVGLNGAGKTTLLRVIAGIYPPTSGTLDVRGRVVPMLAPGIGFQTEATGYENIRLGCGFLGLHQSEIDERFDEIAAFTELGDHLAMPYYTYSQGMQLRLVFAVTTAIIADVLLVDEILNVGDEYFAQKASKRFVSMIERSGITFVASHIESWLERYCTKAVLLHEGRLVDFGPVDAIFREYRRHYPSGAAMDDPSGAALDAREPARS